MALATRCPHCQTTFRVANDQLKLHAGLVRCGACRQTFNGVEHLVPAASQMPTARIQPAAQPPSEAGQISPTEAPVSLAVSTARSAGTAPSEVATIAPQPVPTPAPNNQSTSLTTPGIPSESEMQPANLEPLPNLQSEHLLPSSASAMDFVFGDEDVSEPYIDTPPEAMAARVELETRAALAEPETSWSLADRADQEQETVADNYAVRPPHEPELIEPAEPTIGMYTDSQPDSMTEPCLEAPAMISDPLTGEMETSLADHEKPEFVLQAERELRHGRLKKISLTLASLMLLPLAAAQVAYALRVPLAANLPASKPALQILCQSVGCEISLPAQIDQIIIESNEMLEQNPGMRVYSLTVQLHNQSNVTQAWPQLELVLNDKKDKALMQKAFAPAEYLDNPADAGKGFAPGAVQNIKLYFNLPKLNAAGYHVGVFYP